MVSRPLVDKVSSITLSLDALMYVMTDRTQVAGQAPQDTAFARTLAALAPSQQMPSNPGHPSVFAQNANPIYEGPKPSVELQIDSLRTYWYTNPEVNRVRVINTILATAKAFDPSASMAIQNNSTLMHIHHILGLVRCVERLLTLVGDLSGTLTREFSLRVWDG